MFEELLLRNVGAYSGRFGFSSTSTETGAISIQPSVEEVKRQRDLSKSLALVTQEMAAQLIQQSAGKGDKERMEYCFPPPAIGKTLLVKLTQRMAQNSQAETNATLMMDGIPEDIKEKLHSYFRRSSELLRHFFGIRECMDASRSEADARKLQKIVELMADIFGEMRKICKNLPQSKSGEVTRTMFETIMEQLDWAVQLHKDDRGGRDGGGGFVTVEDL